MRCAILAPVLTGKRQMAEAFWVGIAIFALVGFVVWYYVKQNTPAGNLVRRGWRILLLLFLILTAGYELDEVGWIPHHYDTPVFISGGWMIGEFLTCEMQAVTLDRGATYDYFLDCAGGEGNHHQLCGDLRRSEGRYLLCGLKAKGTRNTSRFAARESNASCSECSLTGQFDSEKRDKL